MRKEWQKRSDKLGLRPFLRDRHRQEIRGNHIRRRRPNRSVSPYGLAANHGLPLVLDTRLNSNIRLKCNLYCMKLLVG